MLNLRTGKAFTRRESIKGLAAILAAECAPSIASAAARGAGGMARMRGAAAAAAAAAAYQRSARAYVQDGLIAMWDCLENVEYGVRTENPGRQWNNLVKDSPYGALNTNYYIESEGVAWKVQYRFFSSSVENSFADGLTLELCSKSTSFGLSNSEAGSTIATGYLANGCNDSGYGSVYHYSTSTSFSGGGGPGFLASSSAFRNNTTAMTWSGSGDGTFTAVAGGGARKFTLNYTGAEASVKTTKVLIGHNDSSATSGAVYAFRVYNRALTLSELAHNYAVDKLRFNLT